MDDAANMTQEGQRPLTHALVIPHAALLGDRWGDYKRRGEPLVVRFSRMVAIGAPDSCWPWIGSAPNGHPKFCLGGRAREASRVAWALSRRKELPAGSRVWTTCRNRLCMNPRHLTLTKPRPSVLDVQRRLRLERVRLVKAGLAAGMSPPTIARAMGTSATTVRTLEGVNLHDD